MGSSDVSQQVYQKSVMFWPAGSWEEQPSGTISIQV